MENQKARLVKKGTNQKEEKPTSRSFEKDLQKEIQKKIKVDQQQAARKEWSRLWRA